MKNFALKILLILIFNVISPQLFSQDYLLNNFFKDFCFTSSLNYVSSATIQLNPNNADLIERNTTVDLKGGYGYGFSLKKRIFGEDMFLGISTEYIKITDDQIADVVENSNDFQRVRVTETVEMIPIEVSVYFNIPRFTNDLNIYLGGGGGFYFGSRTRKMADLETAVLSKTPMFSLNVLFGAEYILDKHFALNFEVKVRDGNFKVHSRFPTDNINIDGQTYYFQQDFESRVYVDGLKMSLGLGYYF